MDKKSFIGLLIIMLIIFLYPYFISKVSPPPKPVPAIIKSLEIPKAIEPVSPAHFPSNQPLREADTVHDTVIENNRLQVKLTNQGAAIKEIRLIRFGDGYDKNPITICTAKSLVNNIFAWSEPFFGYELNQVKFEYEEEKNRVNYRFNLPNLFEIEKSFVLEKNSDLIKVAVRLRNLGDKPLPSAFTLICAGGLTKNEPFEDRYLELDLFSQDKIQREYLRQIKKTKDYPGPINWLALKNKYFCQIITPLSNTLSFTAQRIENNNLEVIAHMPTLMLRSQETREEKFLFFTGPLDMELLSFYNIEWPKIVYFGAFDSIAKLILRILKAGFLIFKNYGIAIILLSILVNIILFPFTWKGMKSMQRLQTLQPQMEKLRKDYSQDTQRLNKEILELYRRNKVNPFGGCLPMLLQMPVFIALYQALSRAIQLKGAHFLWIKDLAAPDAMVKFPSAIPFLGNSLNLLPLIMVFGTYLQQKKSQAYTATSQKQMTWFMPLFLGLIFYNLPSGLILYWVVSTFLNIGLQSSVLAKHFQGQTLHPSSGPSKR